MALPGVPIAASSVTNTSVSVATSSTLILAANATRHGVVIVNDGSNNIYLFLGAGPAVSGSGIRLNSQGGSLELDANSCYSGAIYGIASTAATSVTVCEL